jgi:hypothetical protein
VNVALESPGHHQLRHLSHAGVKSSAAAINIMKQLSAFVPLRVVAKKFLQLGVRRSIRETIKASVFGELLGSAHKPTPRRTRERTAHTHSPHAERSGI